MSKQKKQQPSPGNAPAPLRPVAPLADGPEPVAGKVAVPVLLIALLGLLLYWGDMYLMAGGGGFDARVYGPYESLKHLGEFQDKGSGDDLMAIGERTYGLICSQCHQPNGQGDPSRFIPPLAESEWVLAAAPGRIARIVSKGATGPMKVKGQQFGAGAMFAAGDQLPGDENEKCKQIAGVLTFIRASFGNKAPAVTPAQVKAIREKIKDRTEPYTEEELLKLSEDE